MAWAPTITSNDEYETAEQGDVQIPAASAGETPQPMRMLQHYGSPSVTPWSSVYADSRALPIGVSHTYAIESADGRLWGNVKFQKGAVHDVDDRNGCAVEDLIAVCMDRLAGFQSGKFPCIENHAALLHLREAVFALNSRTLRRQLQGIEGRSVADKKSDPAVVMHVGISTRPDACALGPVMFYRSTRRVHRLEGSEATAVLAASSADFTFDPAIDYVLVSLSGAVWVIKKCIFLETYAWVPGLTDDAILYEKKTIGAAVMVPPGYSASIDTLEGPKQAAEFDWIAIGVKGECWPIEARTFASDMKLVPHAEAYAASEFAASFAPHNADLGLWQETPAA